MKRQIETILYSLMIVILLLNAIGPSSAAAQPLQQASSVQPDVAETGGLANLPVQETATSDPSSTPFPTNTEDISTLNEIPTPASTVEFTPTPTIDGATTATIEATLTPTAAATGTLPPSSTVVTTSTATGPAPLLSFNLSVSPDQAAPGDEVTFTVKITNNGTTPVTNLFFSNKLTPQFGSGKNGFKDFHFDAQSRLLTWDGAGKPANLLPGESLTLQYTVRIDPTTNDQVQVIDSATLLADGLAQPFVSEAAVTVLSSDKELTKLGQLGGKAQGLGGRVKLNLPQGVLSASRGILIQEVKHDLGTANTSPQFTFQLDLVTLPDSSSGLPIQSTEPPISTLGVSASEALGGVKTEIKAPEQTVIASATPLPTATASITPIPSLTATATSLSPTENKSVENDRIESVQLQPLEAKFSKPVELTISLDGISDLAKLLADQQPYLSTLDVASGVWVRMPLKSIDRQANTVTAEITHFSTWGIGIGPSFPGGNALLFDTAYPNLFTGRSNYSVPIWTPAGRNGMVPSLALSYSGGTADGVLGDVQPSWAGMGWNVDTVEIVRTITTCSCGSPTYGYENKFLLLFNGTGYKLIADSITPGRYRTTKESFLYVQLHNDSLGNNSPAALNATGEWWEVVEKNGTRWRLGATDGSEQRAAMKGYPGAATGVWASLGYAGHALNAVAYRWRADQITDKYGNLMVFYYIEQTRLVQGTATDYDRASYINMILYTGHTSASPAPGYSVVFIRESRSGTDMPLITYDADNWDDDRLDRIEVRYGASVVRTYDLNYNVRSYSDDGKSWQTTVLSSVAVSGGSTSAPTTTFTYTDYG